MKVWRKALRILATIFPLMYFFFSKNFMLVFLAIITLIFLMPDIFRLYNKKFNKILFDKLSPILKNKEKYAISSISLFLAASFLTVLFFEKDIAILSLSFLIFGDTAAELIGTKYGRTPLFGKTLEGSIAFFAICIIISVLLMNSLNLNFSLMLLGSLVAAITEVLPLKISDNLTIPLITGLIMTLAKIL